MIKYFKILVIIIVTVICTLLINNAFQVRKESYSPVFYQSFANQSNSIEVDDLQIRLQGFYNNEINKEQISTLKLEEETINNIVNFSKGKTYNLLIDFSNTEGKRISEPIFDYFVYDNLGNVILTSMIYRKDAKETNKFLEYFMKKEYNSNDIVSFNNYIASSGTNLHIVDDSNNSNLILISSSNVEEFTNKLDLSKIHVLILNPSYKISGNNERISQENTIYEFILEK